MDDMPVATLRPGTPAVFYYVHADQLNAPRMVTRPSDNKIAWRWDADPFGTSVPNENPQSLGAFKYNLRYPGQIFDSESSINYNYARDYDSSTGRYIESDPIGLDGGINPYRYAVANPISFSDRSGLIDPYKYLPRPTIPPSNGNVLPGYTPQDGVCSLGGGRLQNDYNNNPCFLSCCKAHDNCYKNFQCNWSSWLGNIAGWPFPTNGQCQKCNHNVEECIKSNAGRDGGSSCKSCVASK